MTPFTIQDISPTIIQPPKNYSPKIEKFPMIPMVEKLPKFVVKELPTVFLGLKDMGVEVINAPTKEDTLFKSTDSVSGAYRPEKRQIDVNTKLDSKTYKFLLTHEIGHSLGIGNTLEDEYLADAFADKFYPGHYSYKNNPYIKGSWQITEIPPEIIIPKFPKY